MFVITPDGPHRPRPTLVYGYGGFGISLTPSYSPFALAWVAAGGSYAVVSLRGGGEEGERWHLAGNRAQQAERLRRPARRGPGAGRRRRHHPGPAGDHGRLERRACWSGPRSPSARPPTGRWSARRRCWTWCATRSSRSAAPGTTSTAPPPTRRSWAGCWPTPPTTACGPAPSTRPCCSPCSSPTPGSTRCTPARCARRCSTPRTGDPDTRPILIRRETDVGHGARSISRTVALATDQLAFLAAHTGLEADRREPAQLLPTRPTCADDAGSWCARFYELTNNDVLSRSADAIVSGTLTDHADHRARPCWPGTCCTG